MASTPTLPRTGALVGGKTLFLPLDALYPECRVLRSGSPQIQPLACLQDRGCHLGLNARCMETLVHRLDRVFTGSPALEQIVLHWQLASGELRGVAFDRTLDAPRVAPLRPVPLRHYLSLGKPFTVPDEVLR